MKRPNQINIPSGEADLIIDVQDYTMLLAGWAVHQTDSIKVSLLSHQSYEDASAAQTAARNPTNLTLSLTLKGSLIQFHITSTLRRCNRMVEDTP